MKDGRKITIKNPLLKNLRNNLRKVLYYAVSIKYTEIHDQVNYYMDKGNSFQKIRQQLRNEKENLMRTRTASIISCAGIDCKGVSMRDMVFDAYIFPVLGCLLTFSPVIASRSPHNFKRIST